MFLFSFYACMVFSVASFHSFQSIHAFPLSQISRFHIQVVAAEKICKQDLSSWMLSKSVYPMSNLGFLSAQHFLDFCWYRCVSLHFLSSTTSLSSVHFYINNFKFIPLPILSFLCLSFLALTRSASFASCKTGLFWLIWNKISSNNNIWPLNKLPFAGSVWSCWSNYVRACAWLWPFFQDGTSLTKLRGEQPISSNFKANFNLTLLWDICFSHCYLANQAKILWITFHFYFCAGQYMCQLC